MAKNDANTHLRQVLDEYPEWIDEAREVLSGWEAGKSFLMPIIALGLKAAYERGVKDSKRRVSPTPPTPKPAPAPPKATATRVRRVR